jgi:hypothetical protein
VADGRPTFRGTSRVDHVALTEGLYRLAHHVMRRLTLPKPHEEDDTPWSDDLPICLSFPCPGVAEARPQEHRGDARATSFLRAPERAEEYGTALWQVRATAALPECCELVRGQDVELLA